MIIKHMLRDSIFLMNSQIRFLSDFPIDQIKSLIQKSRQWHVTAYGRFMKRTGDSRFGETPEDSSAVRFTVMTYNVLAQFHLENHQDLYTHCPEDAISWPSRRSRLIRELQHSKADII